MKITGIIAEYNPFHNGHKYQIDQIKQSGSAVVIVMSGNFVQRGEPAVFDKFRRTELALKAGADVVVELPCCYALQSAYGFAFGGTSILDSLNIDLLSFGSECGITKKLISAAEISLANEESINETVRLKMSEGLSYSNAKLYAELIYNDNPDIFSMPNNLLGIEYIKAIKTHNRSIIPVSVKRKGSNHYDTGITDGFTSAQVIREYVLNGRHNLIMKTIPAIIHKEFEDACTLQMVTAESFYDIINYRIRTAGTKELAEVQGVSEGFENKLKECAFSSSDYSEFRNRLKTKRYTENRISRILMSILLNITKNDIIETKNEKNLYAHILGYRKDSTEVLSAISKNSRIPIITRASELDETNPLMAKDILATDLYFLASRQTGRKDYSTKLITV